MEILEKQWCLPNPQALQISFSYTYKLLYFYEVLTTFAKYEGCPIKLLKIEGREKREGDDQDPEGYNQRVW